jgi:hypothetical protein
MFSVKKVVQNSTPQPLENPTFLFFLKIKLFKNRGNRNKVLGMRS